MKKFSQFNIKPNVISFTGEKIKMARVLNTPITVLDYKIGESKAVAGTKLLTLHIEKNGTKHVIFTGSKVLLDLIERISKSNFPFETTIVKENEYYEFT